MKKYLLSILILIQIFFVPVYALSENIMPNIGTYVRKQTKEQYDFKKVNRKYDTYLVTLVNKNKYPILTSSNTEIIIKTKDDNNNSILREKVYKQTRSKDVGKYYSIGLPSCVLAGGIIGITFGIGIPIGIGIVILGTKPSVNAQKTNFEFAKELYRARNLPLRIEPNQIYQVRVFVDKKINAKAFQINNLSLENNFNKKFVLNIPINNLGEIK